MHVVGVTNAGQRALCSYTPAQLGPLPVPPPSLRTFIRVINVKDPRPNLTSPSLRPSLPPSSPLPFCSSHVRACRADPKGFHRRRRRVPHSPPAGPESVGSPIGGSNVGHCNAATAACACEINNNPADGQSSDSRCRLGRNGERKWMEARRGR